MGGLLAGRAASVSELPERVQCVVDVMRVRDRIEGLELVGERRALGQRERATRQQALIGIRGAS